MKHNFKKNKGYILLQNGKIYDSFSKVNGNKDILVKDGTIVKIEKKIDKKSNYSIVDCKNKVITNGFIDLHVHFREPGFEFKETVLTGSNAAFSGGYTRVCTMPNTSPVIDTPELIKHIINLSKKSPIHIYPIGAITKDQKGLELSEVGGMVDAGAVAISDDGLPLKNSQLMRYALEYTKKFNIPVINHAEDCCLVNDGLMHEGLMSLKLGLAGNPDISESTMIYRDLSIAEYVNGKLHIPHVSTKKSLEVISYFKDRGVNVTVEVTPHHLCFTDEKLKQYDTNAKVAPPIRSIENRDALIDGIKNGIIDCIATDHAPHAIVDKEKDFQNASCGMIGLESSFGLVNKFLSDSMDFKKIINLFTLNPSRVINVNPNTIEVGNEAEINIIDLNAKWKFTEDDIVSKSKNTPVVGETLKGKVMITMNKGYVSNI